MLGKLIKHEFRATGRILLPVYLVMLLTAALVRGFQVLTEQTAGEFMRVLAVLSVLLFSAAVFGGSILAFVLMIYRFYKNLMTDEGYLMFTLPVTTGQLIWSKMIVSAVWLLATAAMDVLSMFISVFDSAAWRDIFQLPGLLWQQLREYAGNLGLIPAELVVLVLLAALVCFLKFYAAIALGHSFTNRKMLLSVAFFAAFSVAEQIAVSAGLIGFASVGIPRSWLRGAVGTMDYYAQMVLGGAILTVVLYGAVYYAVTYLSLKKRLNLSEQQITLAAPNTSMEEMSEFNIGSVALRDIDLNYSNDFVVNVPDDYVNQSGFSTVTLALDSTDLVKKDFVISDIGVVNAPATYNFNVLTQQLKVSIIGPADVMETLDASDLTANVDLLSYSTQAGAVDGDTVTFNYTPTITCSKYNTVWATGDYRVAVQGVRTSGNPTVNSEQTQSDLSENSNH